MEYFVYNIKDLTDEAYEKWFSLMTEEKQERVSRYKDLTRRKCSVAGEMLVKTHIADIFKVAPESLKILEAKNGKPYIEGYDIYFNISHCENMIAYTFSVFETGIDIERIKSISLTIMKRFFSEKEQKYVLGREPVETDFSKCDNPEILERFYRIFTLKEAICKKSGIGIKGLKEANAMAHLERSRKICDFIISII